MEKLKRTCLLVLLLFIQGQIFATHYAGGTAEYEIIPDGNGRFRIKGTYFEFRNSLTNGSPFDTYKEIGLYVKNGDEWKYITYYVLNFNINVKEIRAITMNSFCNQNQGIYTEIGEYTFDINLETRSEDIMFAIQRCCREPNVTNILEDQGMVYYITITKEGQRTGHKSPEFRKEFTNMSLVNQEQEISFFKSASPELITNYSWIKPKKSGGTLLSNINCQNSVPYLPKCLPPFDDVVYHPGFDETVPFLPLSMQNLNATTGDILVKPVLSGNFLIGIKCDVLKDNMLLSTNTLDFHYVVVSSEVIYQFTGKRFYDKNGNTIRDIDEPDFHFSVVQSGDECGSRFSVDGTYAIMMSVNQTTELVSGSPEWAINLPSEKISFSTPHSVLLDTIDIPFVPVIADVRKLNGYVLMDNPRCNELSGLTLEILNSGTISQHVNLTLVLDSLLTLVNFSMNPQIDGDTLTWKNLSLDAPQRIVLQGEVMFPDESHVDEEIKVLGVVRDDVTNKVLDSFELILKVQCAIDPNDKMVSPARTCFNLTRPDEYMYYTIRFENEGNAFARNIVIRDTLSPSLDLQTFEMLHVSHSYVYHVKNRVLEVLFSNIKLLPSQEDSMLSQGQFTFRIKPSKDILEGQIINNSAAIYFDFNEPILTNTTMNTIRSFIAEDEPFKNPFGNIVLQPNPVLDEIILMPEVWVLPIDLHVKIYTATGQFVQSNDGMFGKPIVVSSLQPGLYFVSVFYKGKRVESLPFYKG